MTKNRTRGELHGCIVCGKLHQLYVVYDPNGRFMGEQVMSSTGKAVPHERRPLVACEHHTTEEIERAVARVYGDKAEDED